MGPVGTGWGLLRAAVEQGEGHGGLRGPSGLADARCVRLSHVPGTPDKPAYTDEYPHTS
ncbi:protein of unknown function [Streptantibioticus cattleyicolor NRRL 8057 = DSM 46488]|nr:protein of unknown function [Streptantibioticus cattleyicolor NRRL 8057 = DSM 46488]